MNILHTPEIVALPPMGDVRIYDDNLPEDIQKSILRLVRLPIWAYGWKSAKEHDRFGFWHANFAGGDRNERDDCEAALAANPLAKPVYGLWKHLSESLLQDQVPMRVYANAHTYGVEGYVHMDSDREDDFTVIYYAHGLWDANWSGETVFFSPETGDITKAVYPKPGRVILFRGATPHVARSPSRECPELRISVVFKTRLK